MGKHIDIIKEIIRDNPEDLPMQHTIYNDKISLDRKKRYYIERISIDIPKHNVSIIKIIKQYYKGYFIFERKYDTDISYHIKYNDEIIDISRNVYKDLDYKWYNITIIKRSERFNQDNIHYVIPELG